MTEYTYGPGEWTALAHGGRAALLDPAIDVDAVATIWDSLSQGGSLESWLEVLAGKGLASLPSFGLVEPAEDGVRVVVRGSVTGVVAGQTISAVGVRTWREHVAEPDSGVVLQVEDSEVRHPLIGGLVLAARIQIGELPAKDETGTEGAVDAEVEGEPGDVEDAAAVAPVVAEPGAEEVETEEAGAEEPGTEESGTEESGAEDNPTEEDLEPVPAQESEEEAAAPLDEQPTVAEESEAALESEAAPESEAGADSEAAAQSEVPGQEEQVEPDFVLDEHSDEQVDQESTEAGAAPAAQPWAVPPQPAPQADQWGPPAPSEQQPWQAEQQPWQGEQQQQPWQGEQQQQPWQGEQQQQPWQPEQPAEQQPEANLGDHDGYTMRASDLPQAAAEESPVDHTLAPAQEGFEEEAGSQGPAIQLSLSTGQQVELDRPVLIGRAPESSRFGFGETPRLVTVPSPQQDISRTHVEIKTEGDSVLVTDLRSTNGTVVVLPGAPPRRLHPGESVPVPTGTVVDLGDGVTAVVGQPDNAAPAAY